MSLRLNPLVKCRYLLTSLYPVPAKDGPVAALSEVQSGYFEKRLYRVATKDSAESFAVVQSGALTSTIRFLTQTQTEAGGLTGSGTVHSGSLESTIRYTTSNQTEQGSVQGGALVESGLFERIVYPVNAKDSTIESSASVIEGSLSNV